MISLNIDLNERSYDIEIESEALDRAGVAIASLGGVSRALLVVDDMVESYYGERVCTALVDRGVELDEFVIPAGEESKSIDVAYSLWEQFLAVGADRHSVAIALGGGVVGDLTGFVAATYARGIRYYQIPTTLLAQVDSSVGGKTAIDMPGGKNMVGAFHQPCGVLIDPKVLGTLSDDQYRSGLCEVVKYGASLDREFFDILEQNVSQINSRDSETLATIIARCCQIKGKIVSEDERETSGLRALLNYGHTFGHAIETTLGYGAIPHGYGVEVGSILAARLAKRLGDKGDERFAQIDQAWIDRQISLGKALNLPTELGDLGRSFGDSDATKPERLVELMGSDKKASFGQLNFILPVALGEVVNVKNVARDDVLAVLE
ncbi:MAG: 3-dehydroquinate synthase [Planctomycetia bacterium]|nr:3-dehydroquinate synthase [Planctomycetia bacterium]